MAADAGAPGGRRHVLVLTTFALSDHVASSSPLLTAAANQLAGCALACACPSRSALGSAAHWPGNTTPAVSWAFAGDPSLVSTDDQTAWLPAPESARLFLARAQSSAQCATDGDESQVDTQRHLTSEQRAAALSRRVLALCGSTVSTALLDVLWLTDDPTATSDASAAVLDALLNVQASEAQHSSRVSVRVAVLGALPLADTQALSTALRNAVIIAFAHSAGASSTQAALPLLLDGGVRWRGSLVVRGIPPSSGGRAHHGGRNGAGGQRLRGKAALAAPLDAVMPALRVPHVEAKCTLCVLTHAEPPAARGGDAFCMSAARAWARSVLHGSTESDNARPVMEAPVVGGELTVGRVASAHAILPLALASDVVPLCLTSDGSAMTDALLQSLHACNLGLHLTPPGELLPASIPPLAGDADYHDGDAAAGQGHTHPPRQWLMWPGSGCHHALVVPAPDPSRTISLYAACSIAHGEGNTTPTRALPPGLTALAQMTVEPAWRDDHVQHEHETAAGHAGDEASIDALCAYVHAKWQALHGDGDVSRATEEPFLIAPPDAVAAWPSTLRALLAQQRAQLIQALRPPSKGARAAGAALRPPAADGAAAKQPPARRSSRPVANAADGAGTVAQVAATPPAAAKGKHLTPRSEPPAVQGSVGKPRGGGGGGQHPSSRVIPPPPAPQQLPRPVLGHHSRHGGVKRTAQEAGLSSQHKSGRGANAGAAAPSAAGAGNAKGRSRGAAVVAAAAAKAAAAAAATTAGAPPLPGPPFSKRLIAFDSGEGAARGGNPAAVVAPPAATAPPGGGADTVQCPAPSCGANVPSRLPSGGLARFCPSCGTSLGVKA